MVRQRRHATTVCIYGAADRSHQALPCPSEGGVAEGWSDNCAGDVRPGSFPYRGTAKPRLARRPLATDGSDTTGAEARGGRLATFLVQRRRHRRVHQVDGIRRFFWYIRGRASARVKTVHRAGCG